ncbi:MAG: tail fiber domain-containing protein [Bacteroidia bacterium]
MAQIGSPVPYWKLGGNPGVGIDAVTGPANNFLGTNTNVQVRFGTNAITALTIGNNGVTQNIGIGIVPNGLLKLRVQDNIGLQTSAPLALGQGYWINNNLVFSIPGIRTTLLGVDAGGQNTYTAGGVNGFNTFVGDGAAANFNSGRRNTFLGTGSGYNFNNGEFNTFLGTEAALNFASGNSNTFVGEHSGWRWSSGTANCFFGSHSSSGNLGATGNENVMLGDFSGDNITQANANTFVGTSSGLQTTSGHHNTCLGWHSGYNNTTGLFNTYIGTAAGFSNQTGLNNVAVGRLADFANGVRNSIALGAFATCLNDNHMILGDNNVYVGIGLSNNSTGPQNKLEINSALANATSNNSAVPGSITGTTGASGLRFTDLNTSSTALPVNPHASPAVLTVDANGDVILVSDGGAGNPCASASLNPLNSDWNVPLNTNNYYFTGQFVNQNVNDVAIGYACGSALSAKLSVLEQVTTSVITPSFGISSINKDISLGGFAPAITGIYGEATGNENSGSSNVHVGGEFTARNARDIYAVRGRILTTNTSVTQGVTGGYFQASTDARNHTGVVAIASGIPGSQSSLGISTSASGASVQNSGGQFFGVSTTGPSTTYGVNCFAQGNNQVFAGYFNANSPNSSVNHAIDANALIGAQSWAGYFNGKVFTSQSAYFTSDESLKMNILSITNALAVIDSLNPVSFNFDTAFAFNKGLNLSSEKQYGFTAEDVQAVLPELVTTIRSPALYDSIGNETRAAYDFKGLNYNAFIGILTAGIQEQQLSIDSLRNTSGSAAASNGLSVSSGNTVLGNNLGLTSAQLTNDREIPLNNKRLFFSDAGATSGLNNGIKIGGAGIGILEAKLDVNNASFGNGLNILTTTTSAGATNHGIVSNCSGSSISNYAIEGTANDAASPANIGVRGNARNASGAGALNYGGDFEAYGNASGSSTNIGVSALATPANGVSNTGSNYGGRFKAQQGSVENYGMYAEAQYGSGNNYGVYATAVGGASNYAGYFNGDVTRTGSDNFTSDAMFKTNLDSISDALSIINSLKPRKFNYDTANTYGINFSSKKQYGFVAQDVQTVLPELIGSATHPATRDSAGNVISPAVTYKTLNYQAFTAITIKALQEQQNTIDSMKVMMSQMASLLNSCCSNNTKTSNSSLTNIDVELSDKDAITLSQNAPNPFAEHTLIQYNIPENRGYAQIIFTDLKGQIIKVVDIKTKGRGQLNVFASDLSSGIYTYSLYVDGKLFETKKMLKTQ